MKAKHISLENAKQNKKKKQWGRTVEAEKKTMSEKRR